MQQAPRKQSFPQIPMYGPPISPMTDESWRRWFQEVVWPLIGAGHDGSGPQGTFPQLQIGKASFTNENAFQELLNVDQGIYVNYFSTAQQIIYGFACNVHRSSGDQFTVAGQFNSWGEVGSSGDVFGIAVQPLAQPFSGSRNVVAIDIGTCNLSSANADAKWGVNPVFKDRGDGETSTIEGLGSNLYNYFAEGIVFSAQARSSSGEYCGWNCGIDFGDASLDQSTVPAWSATTTYGAGMIVSSGGTLWKAITASTNQLPAAASSFWVQHNPAGNVTNLAVGIDFSSMSLTSMARMASAIRLRSSMFLHWDETGVIGTNFDAVNSTHRITDNAGTLVFGVNVANGVTNTSQAAIANGGGAVPTMGSIGGSGPIGAAQAGWEKVVLNGVTCFRPIWQ